jgi:sulfite reductase (NADPH) flavoprotein alpha-component
MFTEPPTFTTYTRKNPFPSRLLANRRLTLDGSEKETRHIELSVQGSGLSYEVGDSLGVIPTNCPDLVHEIIQALHATGDEAVPGNEGATKSLHEALLHDYQITHPSKQFIQELVGRGGEAASFLGDLLDPIRRDDLEAYLWGMEYIDFLVSHQSAKFSPVEFVTLLRKLQPRLYSIASSQRAYPDSVHLTVAIVKYVTHGRKRKGVTSTFLASRVDENTRVPVFVHVSKGFRLPEEGETPIIMVGPGTGVAPFRAFLQERRAIGAKGRNWLFFGEQHRRSDFLYGDEFGVLQSEGILTRLDTAFSRDQTHKVYVQHRMLENAGEIWGWLEEGAHFYVCGDAKRMAKDVDAALQEIIEKVGGRTTEGAAEYIENLKKTKRYHRDVY